MQYKTNVVSRFAIVMIFVFAFSCLMLCNTDSAYAVSKPGKVSITSVKKISSSQIKIKWKKLSKNCSGYAIYRSTKSKSGYSRIKTVKSRSTVSYTDSKLSAYTRYYYKIRAYKKYTIKKKQYYNKKTGKWQTKKIKKARTRTVKVAKYKYGGYSNIKYATTSKKTLKSTAYNDCVKVGDHVFATDGEHLYDYNVTNAELKMLTSQGYMGCLMLCDSYLYYSIFGNGIDNTNCIYRMNINTGSIERLVKNSVDKDYVLINRKIYYTKLVGTWNEVWKEWNKNGGDLFNQKQFKTAIYNINSGSVTTSSKYKLVVNTLDSTDSGYYVSIEQNKNYAGPDDWFLKSYLHTPNGTVFLTDDLYP